MLDCHAWKRFFVIAANLTIIACGNAGKTTPDGHEPNASADATAGTFWLPTDQVDNTSAPTVEIDARGGVHAVYSAHAGGRSYYAYCPDGCGDPARAKVVRFTTDDSIYNIMLALDAGGRPQVLLSGAQKIYYATPQGDFTRPESWHLGVVLDHHGDREVTGEAFALDPQGRPRFMMHTYKAYLGIGQKPPEAFFVSCDANCLDTASWKSVKVLDQMLRGSTLRYDAQGIAKVAGVLTVGATDQSPGTPTAFYGECAAGCDSDTNWKGITLQAAWESDLEAVSMPPAISLALTRSGAPRMLMIGAISGKRNLTYYECDADCARDHWTGVVLSDLAQIGAGVDLALDANDHPRFVYTLSYSIVLAYCDEARCATAEAKWGLTKVENANDLKPDDIFLYANCTVAAWFLHDPSIALTSAGRPIVAYQARDVSGGWETPTDPTKPPCRAGTDMTWARAAVMMGVK